MFSFSGGFSVYAASGGARSATDVDISAHALRSARRNLALNQSNRAVAACDYNQAQADAFDWLAGERQRNYDLIILDPPSMAKRESERVQALSAYGRLTELALRRLASGGILAACSCSAHVPGGEFFDAVRGAATRSRKRFTELEITGQPADHPATFPEAYYLKAIYLRFD